jgi:hypothetical protein
MKRDPSIAIEQPASHVAKTVRSAHLFGRSFRGELVAPSRTALHPQGLAGQDPAYRLRDAPKLRGAPIEAQCREAQALGGCFDPRAPKRFAARRSATRLYGAGDGPHLP